MSAAPPRLRLAELLRTRRPRILDEWSRLDRALAPARRLSREALLDHVPDLLERLAERTGLEGRALPAHEPDAHALERLGEGFSVEELVIEYGLLRKAIGRCLRAELAQLDPEEIERLHEGLDEAVAQSVATHTAATQDRLEHAQLRYDRILDSGIVGVIEWDASGAILGANRAVLDMLGYTQADVAAGRLDFRRLTPPEHREATERAVRALKDTGVVHPFEKQYLRRDGTPVDVLISSATLDASNERGIALIVDISDRKRAERELRREEEERRGREEFERLLVGVVSHDLRTPLQAIALGAAALARREDLDPGVARTVLRIRSSAERAARMIRDLLDFTQARVGGGLPVYPRPVNLHELVRQVMDEVAPGYPERDLRLEVRGDAAGRWDPDRLAQVVTNLATNALTYSPRGTPVTVRTLGEPGAARLEVENLGDPIAPDQLPHVFEPLRRASEERDRTGSSIGLGLYIVDQVVRAHGGRVEVTSSAEAGTRFSVWLPREPPRG